MPNCFIIARNTGDPVKSKSILLERFSDDPVRLFFDSDTYRGMCPFIKLGSGDLLFEPYDLVDTEDLGLYFTLFDGVPLNGKMPALPLCERLQIIQDLIVVCLSFSQCVDLYLTSETALEEEYEECAASACGIKKLLQEKYDELPPWDSYVPLIHLQVLA